MVAHSRAGGHQEIHAADMLAQICTEARKAALRVKTKQLRQHWLWLTITKPAEQLAERFAGPCLFNATHHGTCSPKGNPRLHGPFDNVHLDTAYAEQAGWQHSWSLHYNNNLKCWLDSEGYNDLPDKACSSLHKSLHMVMGRPYGALLEAIVATGSCVPLPIPGSMITGLKLKAYLIIESHAPSRSVTYEAAANDTINGIDDLTASMVVARNARVQKPHANTGIGYVGHFYNPGHSIPFQYHVYTPRAPTNRRNYKHHTFEPVLLGQREWPHVYPENMGTIPMPMYEAYERLPVQHTAELSFMTPPPSRDSNPHDLDTAAEASVRSEIINAHIHYPYSEAEAIIDIMNAHDTHL